MFDGTTPPPRIMSEQHLPRLSPLEARVLGVLMEKEAATPDVYPLTLNALLAGCNQKTSRHPVMHATEAEVQMALDALKYQTLVIDSYGASGRVMRFAHNLPKVLAVSQPIAALVAVLMLRGPQTPGELRSACDRLYRFPDISAVEAYLEEMAVRPAGPLVVRLAKQAGSREHRWAHLLSGPVDLEAAGAADDAVSTGELATLKANVARIEEELGMLRQLVERLYAELGVSR